MIAKQIMFLPEGEEAVQGGILIDDCYNPCVICGCCGSIYELDEIEIFEEFDNWVDISYEIRG